jgi:hypothetical protein
MSRLKILAKLMRQSKLVLMPIGDHLRYDLAIDDEGRFLRVQCKTGRLINGAVLFLTCSINSRNKRGKTIRRSYRGEVELFGVYCPDNGKCYLVPVGNVGPNQGFLRVNPPRNGQKTRILWAEDYEIE